MLVELDIFSGRVNPRWQLDEQVAWKLAELHHHLRRTTSAPRDPPGLGYRGFLYTMDGAAWRAWKGFVVDSDLILADGGREIERLLLDQLPSEYLELRPRITAALDEGV